MAKNTSRTFTTTVSAEELAIARAIAAAMNAGREPEDGAPFSAADIFEAALQEGLIELEKVQLGTRSLDHSVRPWESEDDYPKTTPVLLALVKALGGDIAA